METNRRTDILTWAGLFCATLIAYLPALRGGLLWDDDHHVTAAGMRSLHGLWRIWFDPEATQQYYPLLHSAFWMEHRLWGDAVLGYHLTNVLLHAAAACLVMAIVRRLGLPGARLAAFLFALHPVCVEAVAWISEQKSTLSAVLYLAAALVYLQFDEERRRRTYAAATALFLAALLAKSVTATLPAALLVVFWWKRGRIRWKEDVLALAPWFGVAVTAGVFTAWMERTSIGATGPDFALTLAQRVLLAGRALWFYAAKMVWPSNLMFTYPRWNLDASDWVQWLYPAGVAMVTAGLWIVARRTRAPLAAFLYFAGTLFPVLGFLNVYPFLFSFVADHFQYLASLGVIVPVAVGLSRVKWAGVPLALGLGALTYGQCAMYHDSETLYRTSLARNPESWMAHTNLCSILLGKSDGLADAISHCELALRIRPNYAPAHNDLGTALARLPGRLPDAVREFRTAVSERPGFAEAHFNLANALSQMAGGATEAVGEYQEAIRIRPEWVEARMNLGALFLRMPGRTVDAIAQFQTVVDLHPDLAEAHNSLASALTQMPGRLADAIAEYQAAIRLDPRYAKAHNNLGSLLAQVPGRMADAMAEYQAAVRVKPDYADAHLNLGVALAKAGRTDEAIAELEQVVRLEPGSARAHYNLGVLLARSHDRLPQAIREFDAALAIHPDPELKRMVDRLR